MAQFHVIAAKNNERVELVVRYDTQDKARESLHSQGYSIVEIREVSFDNKQAGNVYLFEILIDGKKKAGQIHSEDIFKAYKKLVDDLKYEVISIWDQSATTEDEKLYSTAKVKESYTQYKKTAVTPVEVVGEKKNYADTNLSIGVLGREIQKYQDTIGRIIEKIQILLQTQAVYISSERAEKIKQLIIPLTQLRTNTNIDKLKIVGEAALLKIGEIEVEIATKNLSIKKGNFFKETNQYLRFLGSQKRIGSPIDDAKQKLASMYSEIFGSKIQERDTTTSNSVIDKESFVYFKNLRELSLYKERLKELNKERLRNIFSSSEKKNRLNLKARLLQQNISITQGRIDNKKYSYSKIVKGIKYYEGVIALILRSISDLLLYSILFSVVFAVVFSLFGNDISKLLAQISYIGIFSIFFVILFSRVFTFFTAGMSFSIFFLVSLSLQINF